MHIVGMHAATVPTTTNSFSHTAPIRSSGGPFRNLFFFLPALGVIHARLTGCSCLLASRVCIITMHVDSCVQCAYAARQHMQCSRRVFLIISC